MKNYIIFFYFTLLSCFTQKMQAQQLSTSDNNIVKDIKSVIKSFAETAPASFDSLINYGDGLIAKDTNLLLYNAYPTLALHADKYTVFNYYNDSIYLYNTVFENKKTVLLFDKAIADLILFKGGSNNWKTVFQKNILDNDSVTYLLYKNKRIAFYQKTNDNSLLRLAFINTENTTEKDQADTKNDTKFLNDLDEKVDNVDVIFYNNNKEKIESIQNGLAYITINCKILFVKEIENKIIKKEADVYYKVKPINKMYAQNYFGIKKLSDSAIYYVCSYTNSNEVALATAAVYNLPELKNSKWILLKFIGKDNNLIQKLYLDEVEVGYTIYNKQRNQFLIFLKK